MNIAAIKAYSAAAGVRPTLPARNTVTDGFGGGNRTTTLQKPSVWNDKRSESIKEDAETYSLFNSSGKLEAISGFKGGIFDGKA